ncbi:MAG: M1 family metallopeptidase [Saprospiraceae bacterium]|nr:M1 family metallopeptidase [Saprospiraceae bacterium]
MIRLNNYFFLILFAFSFLSLKSQDAVFITKPYPDYFQQYVEYTIHVELDDNLHELNGIESVIYFNNSPDSLSFLYFHLWPNAYKDDETALAKQILSMGKDEFYFSEPEDKGFIDDLDFQVNEEKVRWELDKTNIDICKIYLNKPLKSGESIRITTPFHVKLPKSDFSRLGHKGQAYYISQWYPKPAVYDKYGWHQMPYLSMGEFYSEFGTFDVNITLPMNYVVGATGDLINCDDEIKWLENKDKETRATKSFSYDDKSFPKSSAKKKTLHYHQENVHDFAWFADKRYYVLKGEIELPYSKRKVTSWAMFTNSEADLWKNSIEYINDATLFYSQKLGDYPYNNVYAVQGGDGGMEYPNITLIGSAGTAFSLEHVIMHEVGHNWFYGILGFNERTHPWMDEGLNTFYESLYTQNKYPQKTLLGSYIPETVNLNWFDLDEFKNKYDYYLGYHYTACHNKDQAINLPSEEFSMINYFAIVYLKSAASFHYLRESLGDDLFDKTMKEFYELWKFKHPQPNDFREFFEKQTAKDLSWFFDDVLGSTKKLDFKIASIKKQDSSLKIKVKNNKNTKGPFSISAIGDYNEIDTTIWFDGFEKKTIVNFPTGNYKKLKIDAAYDIPEINRQNNTIKTKGLFKKTEPLDIQFLWAIKNPNKTQLFYLPLLGWNYYNKWMPGLSVYSNPAFPGKFEFQFSPMYSFVTNNLNGYANMAYNIYPQNNIIRRIQIGVKSSQFNYSDYEFQNQYTKIAPELRINFHPIPRSGKLNQSIVLRHVNISKEAGIYDRDLKEFEQKGIYYYVNDLKYNIQNSRIINPFGATINLQQNKEMIKTSIEANYRFTYLNKKKGFDIRLFAGRFLKINSYKIDYRFRLSGNAGFQDYLYDELFLGRNVSSGLLAHQFVETGGAFKFYTPLGQSWDNIIATNLKASLPGKIPVKLYGDFGFYTDLFGAETYLCYDIGLQIFIIKNIFDIYIPLVLSDEIEKTFKLTGNNKFLDRIRFTLKLDELNPFKYVDKPEMLMSF